MSAKEANSTKLSLIVVFLRLQPPSLQNEKAEPG